jgi:hypothetical protein
MRTSLVGITAAILVGGCSCSRAPVPSDPPEPETESPLVSYAGADLRNLNEGRKAELNALLAATLPKERLTEGPFARQSWAVWPYPTAAERRGLILFEGQHLFMIPGRSSAAVHFFDHSGKYLNSVAFATGWRIDIESAALETDAALGGQLIDVRSAPSINGRDVCRQVYGVIDNRLALLWLEDSTGAMIANTYYAPNHTIGPAPPRRTAEEWEESLTSARPMIVLEALTWLGGDHLRDLSAERDVVSEDPEAAKLVAEVRRRPGVRKTVDGLSRSESSRIQQAAKLAIEELAKP